MAGQQHSQRYNTIESEGSLIGVSVQMQHVLQCLARVTAAGRVALGVWQVTVIQSAALVLDVDQQTESCATEMKLSKHMIAALHHVQEAEARA